MNEGVAVRFQTILRVRPYSQGRVMRWAKPGHINRQAIERKASLTLRDMSSRRYQIDRILRFYVAVFADA